MRYKRQEGGCLVGIFTPPSITIITALGWATYGALGAVGAFCIGLGLAILLPQFMVRIRNRRSPAS